jgi:hypothetical protein
MKSGALEIGLYTIVPRSYIPFVEFRFDFFAFVLKANTYSRVSTCIIFNYHILKLFIIKPLTHFVSQVSPVMHSMIAPKPAIQATT